MTAAIAENTVNQIDALELLRALPDASVDCVLTDPPYGTTACAWDTPIDLVAWWAAVRRVVKPRAAIVMTASQPFTSALVMSNAAMFRHEWVWIKNRGSNFLNSVREPLKEHESVVIFSDGGWTFNPQLQRRTGGGLDMVGTVVIGARTQSDNYGSYQPRPIELPEMRKPSSHQKFLTEVGLHPTQKPVALFEYLIRTYTRPGDLVVDPFGGSGTTAVAARNLGRRWITGDTDAGYCAIMRKRLSEPYTPQLFADEADAVDDAPRQVEMFQEA